MAELSFRAVGELPVPFVTHRRRGHTRFCIVAGMSATLLNVDFSGGHRFQVGPVEIRMLHCVTKDSTNEFAAGVLDIDTSQGPVFVEIGPFPVAQFYTQQSRVRV